jgi:amidase
VATPMVGKEESIFAMSRAAAPVARIAAGTSIRLQTADCFSDQVQGPADTGAGLNWDSVNPATGPVFIEGAEPGDVLAVRIERVEVADHGVMCTGAGWGVLGDRIEPMSWRFLHIANGTAGWDDGPRFAIKPMIGVIGVAPAGDDVPCGTPGSHGGNMDTRLIGEGATIFLPVAVPGALLAAGDLHAAMGDGEVAVTGVEVAGAVTLHVTVRKDLQLTDPVLETDELVATIASAGSLDEAAKMATNAMADLLHTRLGIDLADAVMLMSAVGQVRVSQMVDPLRTVRFEMPKATYEPKYGKLI